MKEKVVILGGAESGVGAAVLAKTKGFEVFLSDSGIISSSYKNVLNSHAIDFEEGQHSSDIVLAADEIVKSPGIPDDAPLVAKAVDNGISVISEIEFAIRHTTAKIIGITGTNGKTTTTLLTYHLLKEHGFNVGMAGNVGNSLAKQVAENDKEYYVVELSSFQLDGMYKSKLHVAIMLNITPDHLNRYENNFQNYIDAKFRIIRNMRKENFFIYNDSLDKNSIFSCGLEKAGVIVLII
jgi:UDP-N-acetylmuramoylalanine--D-glutamate ligase